MVIVPAPVIAQLPVDEGASAPAGPVTVAVKEIVVPSAAVATFAVTETVGVTAATFVDEPEVGDVAK